VISSTMQDFPLTTTAIMRHGARVHGSSECVTWTENGPRRGTYAEIVARADLLAGALARLGISSGDRVGTFLWNSQEHLEAYFAVPSMGAVLHTLNIRLFPEQLAYVINHAADRVIIVDETLIPVLAKVVGELETVEHFIVVGDGDAAALEHGDAGRIVTPVFQPAQSLHEDGNRVAFRNDTHDSTHVRSALSGKKAA